MSFTKQKPKRPEFVNGVRVRMPEGYDFSTKNVDYSQYRKHFILRTDAVWEKSKLKDFFRQTKKIFFFDDDKKKYRVLPPSHHFTAVTEAETIQEPQVNDWIGYTPSGRTNFFNISLSQKEPVINTFNSFYSMPDTYLLCALRFEKWHECDTIYKGDRYKYDQNVKKGWENMSEEDFYPCFQEFNETELACTELGLSVLMQLSYAKQAEDVFKGDHISKEIQSFPMLFDTSNAPERLTFTY